MVFAYAKCSYCGYYNEISSVFEKVKCKMCDRIIKVSPTKPIQSTHK